MWPVTPHRPRTPLLKLPVTPPSFPASPHPYRQSGEGG